MFETGHFQLIRGRQLVADEWQVVPLADISAHGSDDGVFPSATAQSAFFARPPCSAVVSGVAVASPAPTDTNRKFSLLPLTVWLERRQELLANKAASGEPLGVWLGPTDNPAVLANDLALLDLIAIEFPKFVDGRGYSTATLLRQRYGYRGDLRAIGDVGRDQLFYLARVGFDSFLISGGRDAAAALASLSNFPEVYQTACDQAVPLFRRREIQAAA